MVRMGTIWDRTTAVIAGRTAILIGIAALTVLLPAAVRSGWAAYTPAATPGAVAVGGLIGILCAVVTLWGTLSLIAVASDPDADAGTALTRGGARLLPAIGLAILFGVVLALLAMPIILILGTSGINLAASPQLAMTHMSWGTVGAAGVYGLVYLCALIWIAARLAIWNAVILNERRGIASVSRTFALTRGLAGRIIGVLILFSVLVLVAKAAAQMVVGAVAGLIAGGAVQPTVLFLAALAGAVVTTGASIVAAVFVAQLYLALAGRETGAVAV